DQELQEALDSAENEDIEKQLRRLPRRQIQPFARYDFAFSTGNEQDGSMKTAKTTMRTTPTKLSGPSCGHSARTSIVVN
ncbi:hypothetical protein AAVH_42648, partial [Aphelenchoides avenae]